MNYENRHIISFVLSIQKNGIQQFLGQMISDEKIVKTRTKLLMNMEKMLSSRIKELKS